MIDIPIGKALVPVESDRYCCCINCVLHQLHWSCYEFVCYSSGRNDNKNVVFRLVDVKDVT